MNIPDNTAAMLMSKKQPISFVEELPTLVEDLVRSQKYFVPSEVYDPEKETFIATIEDQEAKALYTLMCQLKASAIQLVAEENTTSAYQLLGKYRACRELFIVRVYEFFGEDIHQYPEKNIGIRKGWKLISC